MDRRAGRTGGEGRGRGGKFGSSRTVSHHHGWSTAGAMVNIAVDMLHRCNAGPRQRAEAASHIKPSTGPDQHGTARLGTARHGTARLGTARLGSARHGTARLGSARLGSARLGSARLASARLGSARLGTARHGSARHGTARLGTARRRQTS